MQIIIISVKELETVLGDFERFGIPWYSGHNALTNDGRHFRHEALKKSPITLILTDSEKGMIMRVNGLSLSWSPSDMIWSTPKPIHVSQFRKEIAKILHPRSKPYSTIVEQ